MPQPVPRAPVTCSLCLMGDGRETLFGAWVHIDPSDGSAVVCADSEFFPVNFPVADKVASA